MLDTQAYKKVFSDSGVTIYILCKHAGIVVVFSNLVDPYEIKLISAH